MTVPPGPGLSPPQLLAVVATATYNAQDDAHTRLRSFRNVLLLWAAILLLLDVCIAVLAAVEPRLVPLCEPGSESVCPSGGSSPGIVDAMLVMLVAVVGAALSGAQALSSLRSTRSAYDVPLAQALLKLPAGAATAIVGLLLVAGGLVPGLQRLTSQPTILAYAAVFGAAQQLVTRFVDQRAQKALQSVE